MDTHIPSYEICILDVPLITVTQTGSYTNSMNTSRFAFGDAPAVERVCQILLISGFAGTEIRTGTSPVDAHVSTYGYTLLSVSQLSVTGVASAPVRLVTVPIFTALLAQRAAFSCEHRRNVTWQTDAFAGSDAVSITAAIRARWQTHVTVHVFLSIPVQALAEVG